KIHHVIHQYNNGILPDDVELQQATTALSEISYDIQTGMDYSYTNNTHVTIIANYLRRKLDESTLINTAKKQMIITLNETLIIANFESHRPELLSAAVLQLTEAEKRFEQQRSDKLSCYLTIRDGTHKLKERNHMRAADEFEKALSFANNCTPHVRIDAALALLNLALFDRHYSLLARTVQQCQDQFLDLKNDRYYFQQQKHYFEKICSLFGHIISMCVQEAGLGNEQSDYHWYNLIAQQMEALWTIKQHLLTNATDAAEKKSCHNYVTEDTVIQARIDATKREVVAKETKTSHSQTQVFYDNLAFTNTDPIPYVLAGRLHEIQDGISNDTLPNAAPTLIELVQLCLLYTKSCDAMLR
ncbi:MAG: hypothetical protein KDH94_08780, partial [Coxiellaceae bacterium]|nr:hypothetical protein [Coxiellaceae bacterium]